MLVHVPIKIMVVKYGRPDIYLLSCLVDWCFILDFNLASKEFQSVNCTCDCNFKMSFVENWTINIFKDSASVPIKTLMPSFVGYII